MEIRIVYTLFSLMFIAKETNANDSSGGPPSFIPKDPCLGRSSGLVGATIGCTTAFLLCTDGEATAVLNCPGGTFFNEETEGCDYREVACVDGSSGEAGRTVRWLKYIRIQRQKAGLLKRLKIPPPSAEAKKARLQARAEARAAGKKEEVTKRPNMVRFGIQNVTRAIETREAQLVLIAHDVDPLEVVIFLLALCRNFKIPYAIVKGKAALGTVVRRKVTVPEWSDLVKLGVTKDKGVLLPFSPFLHSDFAPSHFRISDFCLILDDIFGSDLQDTVIHDCKGGGRMTIPTICCFKADIDPDSSENSNSDLSKTK
ncbi:hypothetical protein PRIPAC_95313, partial [Pristionchus pacificus]|uniref:Carbohydrate-binding protein n=1 Tax=Pristionchus pacificus TaxID=54126 RepID=A0A2A6BXV4_PRIPA